MGLVREKNEDAFVCRDEVGLWAVADGLGGHADGELASRTAVHCLESVPAEGDLGQLHSAVSEALQQTNAELVGMQAHYGAGFTPGTTVAVLLVGGGEAVVCWAGDSRIYRLRGGSLQQLTRDHSHVQELVDDDVIDAADAESHPLAHVITRAVGIDPWLALESARLDNLAGDRYLLCTDGLSRLLSSGEIRELIENEPREIAVSALLEIALERGAPDNVTIVLVECGE